MNPIEELKQTIQRSAGIWVAKANTGEGIAVSNETFLALIAGYERLQDELSAKTKEFGQAQQQIRSLMVGWTDGELGMQEEIDRLQLELTQEREASFKKDAALEWYAIPYNYTTDHLDKYGYIPIDKDGGKQAREALGKSEKDYDTAGECAWCDEISSELRHPHMFDRADNGGKMCRICWNMDRETYKGSYGEDIGPFDEEVRSGGNEPSEGA